MKRTLIFGLMLVMAISAAEAGSLKLLDAEGKSEVFVEVSDVITVNVHIDVGNDQVNGVSVYISYDTRYLKLVNPTKPFVGGDFMLFGGEELENKESSSGKLNYTKVTLFNPDSGAGIICQVSFEAISPIAETEIKIELGDGNRESKYSTSTGAKVFDEAENLIVRIPGIPKWDLNADGVINIFDLVLIAKVFGQASVEFDINSDGIVNIFDLVLLGKRFGERYLM